jgi:signal transduction histidine kinase
VTLRPFANARTRGLRAGTGTLAHRIRHPQTTVRWRLTLMYGGLFLICGAALLAITYGLLEHATVTSSANLPLFAGGPGGGVQADIPSAALRQPDFAYASPVRQLPSGGGPQAQWSLRAPSPQQLRAARQQAAVVLKHLLKSRAGRLAIVSVGAQQRISDLHQLEEESVIALAIMAIISAGLGWIVAGRVLRPLVTITDTTQQISEANLHERLALPGPRDELRTVADTIDGLLERLQSAFDAQRRFVANASHELRTPLTAARALLEMVMSDPGANVDTFREVCAQVLEESEQQEQLIDALLALANGQRGIDRRELVDLASVARRVVQAQELDAFTKGLTMEVSIGPAAVSGDGRLVERLVSNLVQNAIRHNTEHGRVIISVGSTEGASTLSVANTGPVVPEDEIERLLQPFQRGGADRVAYRDGLGLGLSIVAAIASAHDAPLDVSPRDGGGLEIDVRFPSPLEHAGETRPPADQAPEQVTVPETRLPSGMPSAVA